MNSTPRSHSVLSAAVCNSLSPAGLMSARRAGYLPPVAGAQTVEATPLEMIAELNGLIAAKEAEIAAAVTEVGNRKSAMDPHFKADPTSEATLKATNEYEAALDERDARKAEMEGLKQTRSTLQRDLEEPAISKGAPAKKKRSRGGDLKTRILESDGFKSGFESLEKQGVATSEAGFQPVKMKGIIDAAELKAVLTGAPTFQTGVGPLIDGERLETVYQDRRPIRMLDRITIRPTGKPFVYWAQQVPRTNVAAVVAEGGTKPKGDYTLIPKSAAMETIAVMTDVSRQALEDVDFLQGEIEDLMKGDLVEKIEEYLVNGNGSGGTLRGILQTTGVLTYTPVAVEDRLVTLQEGLDRLEDVFASADTIALNHRDVSKLKLKRDDSGATAGTGGFLMGFPNAEPPEVLGVPRVKTPLIAAGTYLEGDFKSVKFLPYGGVDVAISESHATNFAENMVTLRVECRGQIIVPRPGRLVKGAFKDS